MGNLELDGRVAVVTGAGRGIGAGIARSLASAGAAVVVAARTVEEITSVAAAIRRNGGRAVAHRTDVTDAFALGSLATAAVEQFGHLDIWVNNAGGCSVGKPLRELNHSEWDACLSLNLTAVWNASMAAVEQMRWGSIINISADPANIVPSCGSYAACKAAVDSLTRTMAAELAPDIRVNGIAPGVVPTQHLFGALDARGYPIDELAGRTPLGLGTPEDIGAAVVFLASSSARAVTGQTLVVAGGVPAGRPCC